MNTQPLAAFDNDHQRFLTETAAHSEQDSATDSWADSIRRNAFAKFKELGFPHNKLEGFRHNDFKALKDIDLSTTLPATSVSELSAQSDDSHKTSNTTLVAQPLPLKQSYCVYLLDGVLVAADTLPSGLTVHTLHDAFKEHPQTLTRMVEQVTLPASPVSPSPLAGQTKVPQISLSKNRFMAMRFCDDREDETALPHLNLAYLGQHGGGIYISVQAGVKIDRPLQLISSSSNDSSSHTQHLQIFVNIKKEAALTIWEQQPQTSHYHQNGLRVSSVGNDSKLHWGCLQSGDESKCFIPTQDSPLPAVSTAIDFSRQVVHVAERGLAELFFINLSGRFTRHSYDLSLAGDGSHGSVSSISLLKQKNHSGDHLVMRHNAPNTSSEQNFRTVVDNQASAIFCGKIIVAEGANKSDAIQNSHSLLLSKGAQSSSCPQLEINHDDVKCAHGATVGQLNDEQIFYLRSRGLSLKQAKEELTLAFIADLVSTINDAALRQHITLLMRDRLNQ